MLVKCFLILFFFKISFAFASSRDDFTELRVVKVVQENNNLCVEIADDSIPNIDKNYIEKRFDFFNKKGIPIKMVTFNNTKSLNKNYFFYAKNDTSYKILKKNECVNIFGSRLDNYIYNYEGMVRNNIADGKYNIEIITAWHSKLRYKGFFCLSKGRLINCN